MKVPRQHQSEYLLGDVGSACSRELVHLSPFLHDLDDSASDRT